MKSTVYSLGVFSASVTSMGILFKNMHWPGANIMLLLGISVFSLLFVPIYARYRYLKTK